jgi:hypothetical protein
MGEGSHDLGITGARNLGLAMERLAKYGEHKQHDFEGVSFNRREIFD